MSAPVDFTELQERHLDMMIRLAFDQEDMEAVQRILDESEPELTPEEQQSADRILSLAREKLAKQEAAEKKSRHKGRAGRTVMRVLEVAACLIVALAIAAPIAFANSATFRSKVTKMMINIDQEEGAAYFVFTEDPDAEFFVPEGWKGEYFPSYMPEGLTETWRDPEGTAIQYDEGNGSWRGVSFAEMYSGATTVHGTDNGTVRTVDVQGHAATLYEGMSPIEGFSVVHLTWANDTAMFAVSAYDTSVEEVLRIARSVKKIIK